MPSINLAFSPQHNHEVCIQQALEDATFLCTERGLRFTPIRKLVLQLIWQNHKPLGAYELLPALKAAGFNSAPPTVYRALDFLQEHGLIHRIALLNAFVGCSEPSKPHNCVFFICRQCKNVLELAEKSLFEPINNQACELNFLPEQQSVELLGICADCQQVNV